jgi:hypothetical protein
MPTIRAIVNEESAGDNSEHKENKFSKVVWLENSYEIGKWAPKREYFTY